MGIDKIIIRKNDTRNACRNINITFLIFQLELEHQRIYNSLGNGADGGNSYFSIAKKL